MREFFSTAEPNQPEVCSVDAHVWRRQTALIDARLNQVAGSVGCDFILCNNLAYSVISAKTTRILTARLGDAIPDAALLVDLDKICQAHDKKLWVVTDNLVDPTKYTFENIYIRSVPQLLGIYAWTEDQSDPLVSHGKLFNCFIQRCESIRQSWFYFLWLEGLLDQGYVSYLLYQLQDYSNLTGVDLFDFIHHNNGLGTFDKFQVAYQELRTKVPYRNFEENFDLMTYINDSKYSVVLETYAMGDDLDHWCVTEKILRSLQSNSISLVFCQKHCVRELENLGLVLDPVNHDWDKDQWTTRQQKILSVLKNDSVPFDVTLQKDRRDHNKHLLHSWLNQWKKPNFFDFIAEEITSS